MFQRVIYIHFRKVVSSLAFAQTITYQNNSRYSKRFFCVEAILFSSCKKLKWGQPQNNICCWSMAKLIFALMFPPSYNSNNVHINILGHLSGSRWKSKFAWNSRFSIFICSDFGNSQATYTFFFINNPFLALTQKIV